MNSSSIHSTHPIEIFSSLIRNKALILHMIQREVLSRYKGSIIGLGWSFFNPLLMLGVYTFLFSFVFKSRWGSTPNSGHADFAIILFVGLIIHGLFSECINRAPILITSNISYVKKVVFPLEIFPWVGLGTTLFHSGISILILLMLQLLMTGSLHWTIIFFPFILIPLILMVMGFSWFLAATGVYVKDISQTTGLITSVMLFISPVFYPTSTLPQKIKLFVMLNPITLIIEEARQVLLFGALPNLLALGIYLLVSLFVAWSGFWWFQKTRKGFADVV